MATAPEIVPYLVRRGIRTEAINTKTLRIDGIEIPIPTNSRQYRAVDLANYFIRDLDKLKARHGSKPLPEKSVPEAPAPRKAEEVTEIDVEPELDDAGSGLPITAPNYLGELSHRELDEILSPLGLSTSGSKADKVSRIIEHQAADANGTESEE